MSADHDPGTVEVSWLRRRSSEARRVRDDHCGGSEPCSEFCGEGDNKTCVVSHLASVRAEMAGEGNELVMLASRASTL